MTSFAHRNDILPSANYLTRKKPSLRINVHCRWSQRFLILWFWIKIYNGLVKWLMKLHMLLYVKLLIVSAIKNQLENLFITIMVRLYTSNLQSSSRREPLNSIEDLRQQNVTVARSRIKRSNELHVPKE